jgi:hypothetical protein
MTDILRNAALTIRSAVEARLFAEYGAIFVTTATPPPAIIFNDAESVERFQSTLPTKSARIGEHEIELQAEAMDSLVEAASEVAAAGGSITARAADSGRRSYEDTVRLWSRNVGRGLERWEGEGRIASEQAQSIRSLTPAKQVAVILDLEEGEQLYFGTFFDRSILYSVAAPGASQHLSMLAFDVAEFQDEVVEETLNRYGWFRTVASDFPHFTYLGRASDELRGLGLKQVSRDYNGRDYNFWVPDL